IRQVTRDALFDLRHPPLHLGWGEVLIAVVHRFELAAIDGNNRFREQIEPAHSTMNWRHTWRIARPLSLRKLAMVLKSGISRPLNHISSTLRCASRSSRRLDWIRFR